MGSFFIDLLSFDHEVAVIEKDPMRMRFTYNCQRFTQMEEVKAFEPELVINAVTVKFTIQAFEEILPYLPDRPGTVVCAMRPSLCVYPPHVRTHFCQPQPAE